MDTASLAYASMCLNQAMSNGFYMPDTPDSTALQLYGLFKSDSILIRYAAQMGFAALAGFWGNERYTTLNLFKDIQALQAGGTAIYGLYGKEDGLYGSDQIDRLAGLLGQQQLMYLDNCSHNVFIDRQQSFISALKKWL